MSGGKTNTNSKAVIRAGPAAQKSEFSDFLASLQETLHEKSNGSDKFKRGVEFIKGLQAEVASGKDTISLSGLEFRVARMTSGKILPDGSVYDHLVKFNPFRLFPDVSGAEELSLGVNFEEQTPCLIVDDPFDLAPAAKLISPPMVAGQQNLEITQRTLGSYDSQMWWEIGYVMVCARAQMSTATNHSSNTAAAFRTLQQKCPGSLKIDWFPLMIYASADVNKGSRRQSVAIGPLSSVLKFAGADGLEKVWKASVPNNESFHCIRDVNLVYRTAPDAKTGNIGVGRRNKPSSSTVTMVSVRGFRHILQNRHHLAVHQLMSRAKKSATEESAMCTGWIPYVNNQVSYVEERLEHYALSLEARDVLNGTTRDQIAACATGENQKLIQVLETIRQTIPSDVFSLVHRIVGRWTAKDGYTIDDQDAKQIQAIAEQRRKEDKELLEKTALIEQMRKRLTEFEARAVALPARSAVAGPSVYHTPVRPAASAAASAADVKMDERPQNPRPAKRPASAAEIPVDLRKVTADEAAKPKGSGATVEDAINVDDD